MSPAPIYAGAFLIAGACFGSSGAHTAGGRVLPGERAGACIRTLLACNGAGRRRTVYGRRLARFWHLPRSRTCP